MAWSAVSCPQRLPLPLGHRSIARFSWKPTGSAAPCRSTRAIRCATTIVILQPNEAATSTHVIPQMRQFTNIMFSGVMNKLKNLRLGFLEAGCGWVPFLISKIEERLERVAPDERPVLPSELFERKQLYFQCGEEVTTKRDVELLGDDCLLWASDFPHEATRTDMTQAGERTLRPQRPEPRRRRRKSSTTTPNGSTRCKTAKRRRRISSKLAVEPLTL